MLRLFSLTSATLLYNPSCRVIFLKINLIILLFHLKSPLAPHYPHKEAKIIIVDTNSRVEYSMIVISIELKIK